MINQAIQNQYEQRIRFRWIFLGLTFAILLLLAFYSVCVGSAELRLQDVLEALFGRADTQISSDELTKRNIIRLLRLPRVLMATLAGAGLSVCGVAMQGITRNPLVSPYTIGVSNAAAFGASLAIMFAGGNLGIQVLSAFGMAMLCALAVYGVSASKGMSTVTIVLMGIALTYLFNALTATVQYFANENQLEAIVRWTFGSTAGVTWLQVGIVFLVLCCALPVFFCYARSYNAMSAGSDEVPKALGISVARVRAVTGLLTVLVTAIIISFTGVIGFVGIVGPHIARLLVGSDHKFLVPFSAIFGGFLLLLADTFGRTLFQPATIPVGIVVAYVGVPIFLHLIISRKKGAFE